MEAILAGYQIVAFDELSPVACSCGQARRAFLSAYRPALWPMVGEHLRIFNSPV